MSLNPSSADGLTGCTDSQVGLGSSDPVTCPGSSKLGDASVHTPLLDVPLEGQIYLGQPVPGKRYRIFLVAERAVWRLDSVGGRAEASIR